MQNDKNIEEFVAERHSDNPAEKPYHNENLDTSGNIVEKENLDPFDPYQMHSSTTSTKDEIITEFYNKEGEVVHSHKSLGEAMLMEQRLGQIETELVGANEEKTKKLEKEKEEIENQLNVDGEFAHKNHN